MSDMVSDLKVGDEICRDGRPDAVVPGEVLLDVRGLSLTMSPGNKRVLDGVSFSVRQGEVCAIVGESGSGKTLTALSIARLLPEYGAHITDGQVMFGGRDLLRITEAEMTGVRGKEIGMIFQEPMTSLNPVQRIGRQIEESIRYHTDLTRGECKEEAIRLLQAVDIPDAEERYNWYPHQLSGGQKQRVMIAMSIACKPKLIIADEATTALDVTVQAQILKLLLELRRVFNLSIVVITHDLGVVSAVADRVAVMHQGRVVEESDRESLFSNPQHVYTQELLASLPRVGAPRKLEVEVQDAEAGDRHLDERLDEILVVSDMRVEFFQSRSFWQFGKRRGNIKASVKASVKAVDGVSFDVRRGETLAIVGESGSGKTTLGKAVIRLIVPSGGEVLFKGENLAALPSRKLRVWRRSMQMVFQDPFSSLNPRLRVGDIVAEGLVALRLETNSKNIYEMVVDLLGQVGLPADSYRRYPHEFSGGQRQRIAIARALSTEPELIVCDEPTSALDLSVKGQVLELLKVLQEKRGISYLFITHDLSLVPTIAHRIAVMKAGKIVEIGDTSEVLANPRDAYTKRLLAAVPELPHVRH